MKYHRTSRGTRGLERLAALVRLASEQQPQESEEIPSIGFAMDEAVKEAMRRLAQEPSDFRDSNELLRVAINHTAEGLNAAIGEQELRFDWEPYLEEAGEFTQRRGQGNLLVVAKGYPLLENRMHGRYRLDQLTHFHRVHHSRFPGEPQDSNVGRM